jgi:hypothetical protein
MASCRREQGPIRGKENADPAPAIECCDRCLTGKRSRALVLIARPAARLDPADPAPAAASRVNAQQHPPDAAELATSAGVAALAALVTTRQNRRSMLDATLPRLNVQVLTGKSSGQLMVAVENSGGGLAQSAGFAVLSGRDGMRASGHFGTGFMRPGEGVVLRLEMPGRQPQEPRDDLFVIVTCRDTREFMHAWSDEPRHRMFRSSWHILRRPRYKEADEVFAEMFPHADPTGSRAVGWSVLKSS